MMQKTITSAFQICYSPVTALVDFLIPHRCALCHRPCMEGYCFDCNHLLPWIKQSCIQCGIPLIDSGRCGRCQSRPPAFERSIIPFIYEAPIMNHIQALKYSRQFHLADALGKVFAKKIPKSYLLPEAIIPVPLHSLRLAQRGFNQSLEIAKVISQQININLETNLLIRKKDTLSQTGLKETERLKNLKQAFKINQFKSYQHVALIDDVVTSGSTVKSAAKVLVESGIARVSIWAIAKTAGYN